MSDLTPLFFASSGRLYSKVREEFSKHSIKVPHIGRFLQFYRYVLKKFEILSICYWRTLDCSMLSAKLFEPFLKLCLLVLLNIDCATFTSVNMQFVKAMFYDKSIAFLY